MNSKATFNPTTAITKVIAILMFSTVTAFAHAADDTNSQTDDDSSKPLHYYIIPVCDATDS